MTDGLDPRWVGVVIPPEHWHFHRQLLRRYGIVLAPGEFSAIVKAIRRRTALLVEQRGCKRAIYHVRIPSAGERIYVLASGCRLITAWPPDKRLAGKRRACQSTGTAGTMS